MVALALNVTWLPSVDDQKDDCHHKANGKVGKGQISSLREVPKEDEGNVQNVVDQVETDEEVEGKCVFAYFTIGSLDVQKLFNSSFVNDHLGDVFILILFGYVQR